MNAALFAFTARGMETARRAAAVLAERGFACVVHVPPRLAGEGCAAYEGGLADFADSVFDRDALVFVGACGIALRAVAPHVSDKRSDPAVLCVDERAHFVIPLLSGHIGGANRLAGALADALGATAVITTATDVEGRFPVDEWAAARGMWISDMAVAKRVSAAILERDIPICADTPLPDELPDGLVPGDGGALGICVSVRDRRPFADTLLLAPKALRVGIGCRRGTPREAIDAQLERVFAGNGLLLQAVAVAATIDVKRGETGLAECCRARGWPLELYAADALNAVPGAFSGSEFVRRTVGVDNVCERAALAEGGRLIVPKSARDGVTVAVAELEWGIDFGRD